MSAPQQGLAASARACAHLFFGSRPVAAEFSYFLYCNHQEHTRVPLQGILPSSQSSCSGIPLETLLVSPEKGICSGQVSVLSVVFSMCPAAPRVARSLEFFSGTFCRFVISVILPHAYFEYFLDLVV